MAELEFKSIKEAAEHAKLQDEKIADLVVGLEEAKSEIAQLKELVDQNGGDGKTQEEDVTFKVGKNTYQVKRTAKFRVPGKTFTGEQLAQNEEWREKLVKKELKSIKKV